MLQPMITTTVPLTESLYEDRKQRMCTKMVEYVLQHLGLVSQWPPNEYIKDETWNSVN